MVDSVIKHRGNRKDLLAICGSSIYRKWKALVRTESRGPEQDGMLAKAGFASFSIDGVELVLDDNCPSGYFYLLDLSTWKWYCNSHRNFKLTQFRHQAEYNNGTDEYLARIFLAHNLCCTKPRNNYFTSNMS